MTGHGKLGVVPARYGADVVGGAETVLRELAHGMAERGWEVEVLTTCARDHYTWENELPAGVEQVGPVTVRRFPAVVSTPRLDRSVLGATIAQGRGDRLNVAQQHLWANDDMRVPELFHHLLDHGDDYRALLFGPYLFWPAFACSQLYPAKSVLWSCVHDEPEVRLEVFKPMFAGLAGLFFQSEPEHSLAHDVFERLAPHRVVGCGIKVPASYDPAGFRDRYGIDGRFVLYAGRREPGKGWDALLRGFGEATRRHDLPFTLVTIGCGDEGVPDHLAGRVVNLGFLPDAERDNCFAAADAYLQPSANEAFSRTVMEAWLAGTPVIATAAGAVVKWHCERSGAGLTYEDDWELEQCLCFVADAPDAARELAGPGRNYVLDHYEFDTVADRIEGALLDWTPASLRRASCAS